MTSNNSKEKMVQMQMLSQQIQQAQKYLEKFEEQLGEITSVIESLEELSKVKTDSEVLAPIANGIFVKTKLQDNKELLINVGANTVVAKSIEDAKEMLESQKQEIEKYYQGTQEQIEQMAEQADMLHKEMNGEN
jgi:prefoldin alpha subunit